MSRATTPARAARRHRARVSFWLGRALAEALRLGAGPAEVRALASVAAALRMKAQKPDPTTAPPPRP
jgi:hypothetical protein